MFDLSCIQELVNTGLTLILAVATVYLAIYTYRLVDETRKARKAQIQPYISIHLEYAQTDPYLIFILIQNIGQGAAYNLKFVVQKDFGDYGNEANKISDQGLFKNGMKFCPPGYSKKYLLVDTKNNYVKKMDEDLIFKAQYQNLFQENFEEDFFIRLKEQKGSYLISPDTYIGKIAENLNDIKKILEQKILKDNLSK